MKTSLLQYVCHGRTFDTQLAAITHAEAFFQRTGIVVAVEEKQDETSAYIEWSPSPNIACALGSGSGLAQIRIMRDGTLRFFYELDMHGGGSAGFSLLSEVGEPYQHLFKQIMKAFNVVLGESRDLMSYPWITDTLLSVDTGSNYSPHSFSHFKEN